MSGSYGIEVNELSSGASAQAVAAGPAQWFAVQTRYRFEKKVAGQLERKRFQVYLPLRTEQRNWSDRTTKVTIPLFPGYAFVSLDQSRESRQAVLQTAGLLGFVSFGATVIAVPEKQIEDLQMLLQANVQFSLHPFVRVGQRVRVRGGCLHGLEGVLLQNEKNKLVVSIQSIERSLTVEIQDYELEMV